VPVSVASSPVVDVEVPSLVLAVVLSVAPDAEAIVVLDELVSSPSLLPPSSAQAPIASATASIQLQSKRVVIASSSSKAVDAPAEADAPDVLKRGTM
jgi:hypothetical protein